MTSYFIPPDVEDRIEWLMKRGRRHEAFALVAIEWFNPGTFGERLAELFIRIEEVKKRLGLELIDILQRLADSLDD